MRFAFGTNAMNTTINNKKPITIATLGSTVALDVCRGAKDEEFKTLVVCEKGRERTYTNYYKTKGKLGCVDECIVLSTFSDILNKNVQKQLIDQNTIFIPNRSFEAYLHFNYEAIENEFLVSMFGNKNLLRIEERGSRPNQYDLLQNAHIRYPQQFYDPKDIDRVCLVKVLEKARGFERAFFLVDGYKDFQVQVEKYLKQKMFTKEQLEKAVIEEFIVGVQVNFNFFYSPLHQRLELLGTDTRRQTNFEGIGKLPHTYQSEAMKRITVKYEEAGHIAVTVLESLLEQAFELGERFVAASQTIVPPGIVGPFALQTIIVPGPPKKDIVVIDVSPRIPGSPGIAATPYGSYLFGTSISMGGRIAIEIKEAIKKDKLNLLLT